MKKLIISLFMILCLFGLFSCGEQEEQPKSEYMTYQEFKAAQVGDEVKVEAYVQGFESWWGNKQTFYLADKEGNGYMFYETPVSEEESKTIKVGTKLSVKGLKSEWAKQVEVTDMTEVKIDNNDTFVASAKDLTNLLTNANAASDYAGQLIKVTGTIVGRGDDKNLASTLGHDNSGEYGKTDLYVTITTPKDTFNFTVRRYLGGTAEGSVYHTLANWGSDMIGREVELTAFVYMYDQECQARIIGFVVK